MTPTPKMVHALNLHPSGGGMRLVVYAKAGIETCDQCQFQGYRRADAARVCMLFPTLLNSASSYTILDDTGGRVTRCDECVAAERRE
jgi:hypothetical protein